MSAGDREGDDLGVLDLDPVAGLDRLGRSLKGAEKDNGLHGPKPGLVADVENSVPVFDFRRLFDEGSQPSVITHTTSLTLDSAAAIEREFLTCVNGLDMPFLNSQTAPHRNPPRDRQSPLPSQRGLAFSTAPVPTNDRGGVGNDRAAWKRQRRGAVPVLPVTLCGEARSRHAFSSSEQFHSSRLV